MATFTLVHVLISLLGIAAGYVVLTGMIGNKRLDGWTGVFLAATVATSVTGFLFPINGLTPAHVVGILSLILLSVAIVGRYQRNFAGGWRQAYVIGAVASLYLNVFVLIVQSFQKIPALKALAPTQSEPPFAVVQGMNLVAFVALGIMAAKRFQPAALAPVKARAHHA